MNLDDAVRLVVEHTNCYPIHAFEHEGVQYVYITPLSDYDSSEDVAACYELVKDGRIIRHLSAANLLYELGPETWIDAISRSLKSYRNTSYWPS